MRIVKGILILVLILVLLLGITVGIALWFVFTPEKLTPIVRQQVSKQVTCTSNIGKVELTFFSTFPQFGLKINQLKLTQPFAGANSDTLLVASEVLASVDFMAWWKNNQIIVTQLDVNDAIINLFLDSTGNANYNILPPDTTDETSSPIQLPYLQLDQIAFNNVQLTYTDLPGKMEACLKDFTLSMEGSLENNLFRSVTEIENGVVTFVYNGEPYLQEDTLRFNTQFEANLKNYRVEIARGEGTLNEIPLQITGTFAIDSTNNAYFFDLNIDALSSSLAHVLTMVPPTYKSYIEGMDLQGKIEALCTYKGIMINTTMPVFHAKIDMEEGTFAYSGVPISLNGIRGNVTFETDGVNDSLTWLQLNQVDAKTKQSAFTLNGRIDKLFTDVRCNLLTNVNLTLEEFAPMIPPELKLNIKGMANGHISSAFTLQHIENMQLEMMKLSGNIALSDFDLVYDSILLNTNYTKIAFTLPNSKSALGNTRFVSANIETQNLEAGIVNSYRATVRNLAAHIESSDVRDTTQLPNLICSFKTDSLAARYDTIQFAVTTSQGHVNLSPREKRPLQPQIKIDINIGDTHATAGNNQLAMNGFVFKGEVVNDAEQKDIFLQWLVKGFLQLKEADIRIDGFTHAVEIPTLQMDFSPELVNIKEGCMKIGGSDFQLSGVVDNILPYYNGDSLLHGNLFFTSEMTNINELMALTSGIGNKEEKNDSLPADTAYTGPYIVPTGMDISLHTNITKAAFGSDSATDISGEVRIANGLLVLENVKLTTPAARMKVTAMYRTPRKNHLYLGIDYHMFDVEIEELLRMIPDIDTLMPMLRSFSGKGEFHLAVETYLDSLYNLKKSTLRGASSIVGQNLVLMDGETFSEIAKTLKFNKKTENRVDSLSAEFTVFRDEIDIYPFLIVLDKYKAVVAGRHNFDMSFDYHISLVDSPLPLKLGIDIKGNLDKMNYKLATCRYAEFYRPTARKVVENKQLELRQLIRNTLLQSLQSGQ